MFFYFIHCSLGTGPGSAVGERGIKRETAKKSAREANRTLHWRGKREAKLRQPPPFPTPPPPPPPHPNFRSVRFARQFFFGIFLPTSEPAPGLHSLQALHYFISGDDSAPVYIEKNRGTLFRKRGSPPAEP